MTERTGIEWADSTFNPWTGCTKVSPACDHCYAESWSKRAGAKVGKWGAGEVRVRTSLANWRLPVKWNAEPYLTCACGYRGTDHEMTTNSVHRCGGKFTRTRRRVFCASLGDWLDNEVDIDWLVDLLDLIRQTPNLVWQLLTKRIGLWLARISNAMHRAIVRGLKELADWLQGWIDGNAPENVWILATVCNQLEADRDVPKLLSVPALVRGLSIEPMLGPVDLRWLTTEPTGKFRTHQGKREMELRPTGLLHWVICGGESGPHARPMHPDWVRSLRDQGSALGFAFMFKQWGEWWQYVNERHYTHGGKESHPHAWVDRDTGEHGLCWIIDDDGTWSNWTGEPPKDQSGKILDRVRVMGWYSKKLIGNVIDGRSHLNFPEVAQ